MSTRQPDDGIQVSVVITTRNRSKMLQDCLQDLIEQEYDPTLFEIVIVDDASSDGTDAMVESLSAADLGPALRYVSQARSGPSSGRNQGVRVATGRLIAFVDDDVLIPTDWLRRMVAAAERYEDYECLAGRVELRLEGRPPRTCGREPLGESEVKQGDVDRPADIDGVGAGNMLVRRTTFDRVGFLMEELPVYGEETEWLHRLAGANGKIMYVADAHVWHRRGAEQLRLARMLKARYHRGRSWPRIAPHIQRETSFLKGMWQVIPSLAHAGSRRCWVGVFDACYWLGHSVEALTMLLSGRGGGYVRWLPRNIPARLRHKLPGFRRYRIRG